MDLRGVSDIADAFVIATCIRPRKTQAAVQHLLDELRADGLGRLPIRIRPSVRWVCWITPT